MYRPCDELLQRERHLGILTVPSLDRAFACRRRAHGAALCWDASPWGEMQNIMQHSSPAGEKVATRSALIRMLNGGAGIGLLTHLRRALIRIHSLLK